MKKAKTKTPKKENKQIVEVHIYVHQTGGYNWYPNTITNPPWKNTPNTPTTPSVTFTC